MSAYMTMANGDVYYIGSVCPEEPIQTLITLADDACQRYGVSGYVKIDISTL